MTKCMFFIDYDKKHTFCPYIDRSENIFHTQIVNINETQPRQGWVSLIFTICVSIWDSLNITNLNDMESFKLVIFRLSYNRL